MDQIIESIRSSRDEKINQLLVERSLLEFLQENYSTSSLSPIKKEFLLKDLLQLKHSPLDLSFYSSLITKMKERNQVSVDSPQLILEEIRAIVNKYIL